MKNETEPIRSKYAHLALPSCQWCAGAGVQGDFPCKCVHRAMFRACYGKFRDCQGDGYLGKPLLLDGCAHGHGSRIPPRRPRLEFIADFCLTAERVLTDPLEYQLFRFHYLLGADWKLCCPRLGLDRGNFFHMAYRVEAKLGKVFAELQPYPLYPTDDYFARRNPGVRVQPLVPPAERYANGRPVIPPLRKPLPKSVVAEAVAVRTREQAREALTASVKDLASFCRARFRRGLGLHSIAESLTRLGVPSPDGGKWRESQVRRTLLDNPREQAQVKRAA